MPILKCPKCAKGNIFASYSKIKPATSCVFCGEDFTSYNVGDSPAYFSIFTVGALVPVLAVTTDSYFMPPLWVHALIWLPVTILFCYLTLIYIRSIFIHIEYKHQRLK